MRRVGVKRLAQGNLRSQRTNARAQPATPQSSHNVVTWQAPIALCGVRAR